MIERVARRQPRLSVLRCAVVTASCGVALFGCSNDKPQERTLEEWCQAAQFSAPPSFGNDSARLITVSRNVAARLEDLADDKVASTAASSMHTIAEGYRSLADNIEHGQSEVTAAASVTGEEFTKADQQYEAFKTANWIASQRVV